MKYNKINMIKLHWSNLKGVFIQFFQYDKTILHWPSLKGVFIQFTKDFG